MKNTSLIISKEIHADLKLLSAKKGTSIKVESEKALVRHIKAENTRLSKCQP